jgi:DMSO/TMAO reductase YedYZ molybdopterin-dependent catalytic subunit
VITGTVREGVLMRRFLLASLTGIVAVVSLLGVAELLAGVLAPEASPIVAVGQLAIDLAPHWLKDLMIALFGTGDKVALFVILGVVVLIGAIAAGNLELRWPPSGAILLGIASAVALIAVLTRPSGSVLAPIPTAIGAIIGVIVLRVGTRRLRAWISPSESALRRGTDSGVDRRRFLGFTLSAGAIGLIAGIAGRVMGSATAAVTAARDSITLPPATTAEAPVPAGAELDVEGISPLITPNPDFYRIDIALQVPRIDPQDWSLRIHGLVDTETTLSYQDVLDMPLVEHTTTIACVSNEVGGDLIGTATWLGVPIRDLLERAGVQAGADMILSTGPDGFSAGSPVEFLTDPDREALLAVGMNGEPLPIEHGFPARLIVPGLYGYVSATKWVQDLKATRFADEEGYWTPRGWSATGPIKTQSRIDTPYPGQSLSPGTVPIAGVAWAQHTGISGVAVRIDDGPWQDATLATAISTDTWVQWVLPWQASTGDHTISVRATDASGYTQTDDLAPPAPNGATGWHTIVARVG